MLKMEPKVQNQDCIKHLIDKLNHLNILSPETDSTKNNFLSESPCSVYSVHDEGFCEIEKAAQEIKIPQKLKTGQSHKKELSLNIEQNKRRSRKKASIKVEAHLDEESVGIINAYPADSKNAEIESEKTTHTDSNYTCFKDIPVKKENVEEEFKVHNKAKSEFITDLNLNENSFTDKDTLFTKCVCLTAEHNKTSPKIIERGRVNSQNNLYSSPSSSVLHKTRSVPLLCGGKVINSHQFPGSYKALASLGKLDVSDMSVVLGAVSDNGCDDALNSNDNRSITSDDIINDIVESLASDDIINDIVESPTSDESGYDSPTFDIASSPPMPSSEDLPQHPDLELHIADNEDYFNKRSIYSYLQCPKVMPFAADGALSKEEINERLNDITEVITTVDPIIDDHSTFTDAECKAGLQQQDESNRGASTSVGATPVPATSSISFQIIPPTISLILNIFPVTLQTNGNLASVPANKTFRKIMPKPGKSLLKDIIDIKKRDCCFKKIYSNIDKEKGCIYVVDESTNNTNLHLAIKGNRSDKLELIYCLVNVHLQYKKDAIHDINMKDAHGKTARDYALEAGNDIVAEFLNMSTS